MAVNWKLIPYTYTSPDAGGASADTSYDLGALVKNDEYYQQFKLGNTASTAIDLQLSVSGVNSNIIEDVEFSLDNGLTYYSSVTISGLQPNMVSDIVICRLSTDDQMFTTSGTFIIRVDEV